MKRMHQAMILPFAFSLLLILSACNANDPLWDNDLSTDTVSDTSNPAHSQMIKELEDKIIELQQSQYISDAEHQEELERLQNLLTELKAQISTGSPPNKETSEKNPSDTNSTSEKETSDTETDQTTPSSHFLYKKEGENAVITGYTGSEAHVVIPAKIDGYTVTAIGDSAFSSDSVKSVIISNGITKIDWFAFSDCPSLISVTIPDSVTSIGYSAFVPQDSAFTIYCHSGSFAYQYAKSYGWSYALI